MATNCANFAELEVAVHDTEAAEINLTGSTYTMTEALLIDHDCVITNTSGSDVLIDGVDSHRPQIIDADIQIVGHSDSKILFTQGGHATNAQSCYVAESAKGSLMTVQFDYCQFTEGCNGGAGKYDGSGLYLQNANAELRVICNNCEASDNDQDGFSIKGADNEPVIQLILNDCDAENNGNNPAYAGGGGQGDGATTHYNHNCLIINGGNYKDNYKSGVAVSDGTGIIEFAEFSGNGEASASNGGIIIDNNGAALIQANTFTGTVAGRSDIIASSTCGGAMVMGNVFRDVTNAALAAVYVASGKGIFVLNNVFYNLYTKGIYLSDRNLLIRNNIFHTCGIRGYTHDGGIANYGDAYCYDRNPANGYNCFYNNAHDVVKYSDNAAYTGDVVATDILENPRFRDAANADFRVHNTKILESGFADISGIASVIGAAGRLRRLSFPSENFTGVF